MAVPFALQHNALATPGGGDVVQRITVEQYQIRSLTFLDRADLVDRPEEH